MENKNPHMLRIFVSINLVWYSMKDDYITLAGLEDVNVVDFYTTIDGEEDNNEGSSFLSILMRPQSA